MCLSSRAWFQHRLAPTDLSSALTPASPFPALAPGWILLEGRVRLMSLRALPVPVQSLAPLCCLEHEDADGLTAGGLSKPVATHGLRCPVPRRWRVPCPPYLTVPPPSMPPSRNIRRRVVYGFPPHHRIHLSYSSPESAPSFCLKTLPGRLRGRRGEPPSNCVLLCDTPLLLHS